MKGTLLSGEAQMPLRLIDEHVHDMEKGVEGRDPPAPQRIRGRREAEHPLAGQEENDTPRLDQYPADQIPPQVLDDFLGQREGEEGRHGSQ